MTTPRIRPLHLVLLVCAFLGALGVIHPASATDAAVVPEVSIFDGAQDDCERSDLQACVSGLADAALASGISLLRKLPLFVLAVLIVLASWWFSRFVGNRLHWLRVRSRNPYMNDLMRMVVRTLILVIGVITALDLLGMTAAVGAVLGSAGVAGLVLGFAFRDIAENYIASILLSVRRPFAPGDHLLIDSHEGKVVSVTSRATVLMTLDGNHLQLPNSVVFKSVLLNYTRNPKRRFDFTIQIDTGESITRAKQAALAAIAQTEGVLDDPGPSWLAVEHQPSGITLRFLAWIDQRESDFGKARSEALRRVKAAFAAEGIHLPRTTYYLVQTSEDAADAAPGGEHLHRDDVDTSVNRDIDAQLEEAQREEDADDMLQHLPTSEPASQSASAAAAHADASGSAAVSGGQPARPSIP